MTADSDLELNPGIQSIRRDGLAKAIAATFQRQKTEIPDALPDGLSEPFGSDPAKLRHWQSFIENIEAATPGLIEVVSSLAEFLLPRVADARRQAQ
jgi:hypothetical protein